MCPLRCCCNSSVFRIRSKEVRASRRRAGIETNRYRGAREGEAVVSCTSMRWLSGVIVLVVLAGGRPGDSMWTSHARMTKDGAPQEGACEAYGRILAYQEADNLARCEGLCATTRGCQWYSYCPDHLDPALPTWANFWECSGVAYSGQEEPLSVFGTKKNKCVLYSECYRVGKNLAGQLNYMGFFSFMYSERSVISGENTEFPPQLPQGLMRKHDAPDGQHPSLKFWFTPEALQQQGYRTGDKVTMWWNVANICVPGHPDQYISGVNITQDLTYEGQCSPYKDNLYVRGQRPQEYGTAQDFLSTAGNLQKELFLQKSEAFAPIYDAKAANGKGALKFKRSKLDGTTSGRYMFLRGLTRDGFQGEDSNMFSGKGDENTPVPAYQGVAGEFTVLVVFRTRVRPGSTGHMGILNIVGGVTSSSPTGGGLRGLSLYRSDSACKNLADPSANCPRGKKSQISAINAIYGTAPAHDRNSCGAQCGRYGCGLSSLEFTERNLDCSCSEGDVVPACSALWGEPEMWREWPEGDDWTLVALRGKGHLLEGWVNGRHWMDPPPIYINGTDPWPSVTEMRIGLMDSGGSAANGFLDGDIAEIMVYDRALAPQELDRLAHYMAKKFDLKNVKLNSDILSPYRAQPVSRRHQGCAGSLFKSGCNSTAAPYSVEGQITARWGEPYAEEGGVCRPRLGKDAEEREEVVTITGRFMLPTDVDASTRGYGGDSVPAGVPSFQLQSQSSRYLKVTVGDSEEAMADCRIWQVATGTWHCRETGIDMGEMGGIRYGMPFDSVIINNGTHHLTCEDKTARSCCVREELEWLRASVGDGMIGSVMSTEAEGMRMPTLRCTLPKGKYVEMPRIAIYWHGMRTEVERGGVGLETCG